MRISQQQGDLMAKAILILIGAVVLADIGSLAYVVAHGLVGKLWKVVWSNFEFPIVLGILALIGFYWKFKYPEDFTFGELAVYIVALPIVAFPFAAIFYFFATDLHDREIWNGRVQVATYEEKWTELVTYTEQECTGSGKDQVCTTVTKTRHDYHPPKWYITTSNDETISVSSHEYRASAERFGSEVFKRLYRANQVSFGDGNMYYAEWKGQSTTIIPTAVEHPFVNYLRASNSITKINGVAASYKELLLPYPRVHGGRYGYIEIDRVLSSGVSIPEDWRRKVSDGLSVALTTLGSQKQVNILVYVTSADINFFYALKEHWTDGKKNDVIVVVGSRDGSSIDWVQVQAWTKIELFKMQLSDSIRELKTLSGNAERFVETIVTHVARAPDTGGFQRMPMAELEYLLVEIKLPWWASILVVVLNMVVVTPIIFLLLNNSLRRQRRA